MLELFQRKCILYNGLEFFYLTTEQTSKKKRKHDKKLSL